MYKVIKYILMFHINWYVLDLCLTVTIFVNSVKKNGKVKKTYGRDLSECLKFTNVTMTWLVAEREA